MDVPYVSNIFPSAFLASSVISPLLLTLSPGYCSIRRIGRGAFVMAGTMKWELIAAIRQKNCRSEQLPTGRIFACSHA